jgi:nitrate reductase delta subunit
MTLDQRTFDLLGDCLRYPVAGTATRAREAAAALAPSQPALAAALWGLAVYLERAPEGEPEERYTMLFDLQPVCTLHVGYHVFGDTYPRGELLAGLGAELRQAGISTHGDLPDFLPTVFRLLGRLDPEDARLLSEIALLPALRKMAAALADSKDPWSRILHTLPEVLAEEGDLAGDPRVGVTEAARQPSASAVGGVHSPLG